jgi:hypothetical protein
LKVIFDEPENLPEEKLGWEYSALLLHSIEDG